MDHLIFSFLSAIGLRAALHLFSNFLKFKQIVSQLLCVSKCGLAAHDPVLLASPIHGVLSAILLGAAWTRCCCLVTKSCPTVLQPQGPAVLLCPWDFPGKNTGVGCHFLHQGIFPTQGSNLHWQADSLPPSHQGNPTWSKFSTD